MRPIRRGKYNKQNLIEKYQQAKKPLIEIMGEFCCYCERHLSEKELDVEHILPKEYFSLFERTWVNLLLACGSCNSRKGTKKIIFREVFLPDVDNTFFAFSYYADGSIVPNLKLNKEQESIANNTLEFFGLTKNSDSFVTFLQPKRMEAWGEIEEFLRDYEKGNVNIKSIIKTYKYMGFFSIWMTIFQDHPDVKNALINASPSTRESGCFDMYANPITPAPNYDNLLNGGKV